MPYQMYVSLQDDDKIMILDVDSGSGKLTPKGEVPIAGGPSGLAISPDRGFLYVGHRNSSEISSHRIDPSTGGLTQNGTVALEAAPTYVTTDRKGRFVLSSYYQGAHAAVHPIGSDGSVGGPPIEWLETATGAHSIHTDPTNKFAFVPHIASRGPNAIYQFKFDENTGHLSPNSPLVLELENYLGPRHHCFHPTLNVLYTSDEQGCSVSSYRLDPATGTLSSWQTVTTLPEGYTERNSCSQIQVSPSGKFLYAPNRGHNSIACFSVDPTGQLSAIGRVPSEAIPNAFSLDPAGKFLYAAGQESGRMASYRVNEATGELTPMETYPLGNRPVWVLITNLGG